MKISAKQIVKGMKVQFSDLYDIKDHYTRQLNGNYYSEIQKNEMRQLLLEEKTISVKTGSIKKNSPIYTILNIEFAMSWGQRHNGKMQTNNFIWLITDKGNVQISTRQQVELI
jgi:6-pyruvoyl-tetrahydropterin synthase